MFVDERFDCFTPAFFFGLNILLIISFNGGGNTLIILLSVNFGISLKFNFFLVIEFSLFSLEWLKLDFLWCVFLLHNIFLISWLHLDTLSLVKLSESGISGLLAETGKGGVIELNELFSGNGGEEGESSGEFHFVFC